MVDKGKGLVIKGFPGMSKVIYCNSSKEYTVIEGNTSKTIINLRISNNLPVLNQNYHIDQSEIVYMYVSCTYVLKVRRSS